MRPCGISCVEHNEKMEDSYKKMMMIYKKQHSKKIKISNNPETTKKIYKFKVIINWNVIEKTLWEIHMCK